MLVTVLISPVRCQLRKIHIDDPPPLLGQLGSGLCVGVVHGEVGDDDGDGEGDHEDPGHGAHRPHEHPEVGLGHHVTITHLEVTKINKGFCERYLKDF